MVSGYFGVMTSSRPGDIDVLINNADISIPPLRRTVDGATADLPGDSHVGPKRMMGMRGAPALARRAANTRNAHTARRLWEESERLTGAAFPLTGARPNDGARR